jgi:hypothetical protein
MRGRNLVVDEISPDGQSLSADGKSLIFTAMTDPALMARFVTLLVPAPGSETDFRSVRRD